MVDASQRTPRYERKYRVENVALPVVREIIRQHPASFRTLYPNRQINNIYFDTPDFHTYRANVVGIGERQKFRVRWYGSDYWQIPERVRFEVKHRSNQTGTKDVHDFAGFVWENLPDLTERVNQTVRAFGLLHPVLLSHYQRAYLGTSDGRFRLTIDTEQGFLGARNQQLTTQTRAARRFRHAETGVVLELKYDAEHDDAAQRIMQELPFRQTKSSKYVNGVDLVYGVD